MGSAFRETSGPLPPWALSGEALSACITCLKLQNYAPFRDHAGRLNHLKLDLSGKKGLGVSPLTVDSGVSATRDLSCLSSSPSRSGPWKPCLLVPGSAKRQGASEQLQGLRAHSCDRGSYCQALARASRAPAPLQLLQVPASPVQMVSRREVCTYCVPRSLQNPGKTCGTPS